MKSNHSGHLILTILLFVSFASTGCKSGWKISNPFSSKPKPVINSPVDNDLELTPPPEQYTEEFTQNTSKKRENDSSLAQEGKYDSFPSSDDLKPETSKIAMNQNTESQKTGNIQNPIQFPTPDPIQQNLAMNYGNNAQQTTPNNMISNNSTVPSTNVDYSQNLNIQNNLSNNIPSSYSNLPSQTQGDYNQNLPTANQNYQYNNMNNQQNMNSYPNIPGSTYNYQNNQSNQYAPSTQYNPGYQSDQYNQTTPSSQYTQTNQNYQQSPPLNNTPYDPNNQNSYNNQNNYDYQNNSGYNSYNTGNFAPGSIGGY